MPSTTKEVKSTSSKTTKSNVMEESVNTTKITATQSAVEKYGYVSAWNTISGMETDLKHYFVSIGGVVDGTGIWDQKSKYLYAYEGLDSRSSIQEELSMRKMAGVNRVDILVISYENAESDRASRVLDLEDIKYLKENPTHFYVVILNMRELESGE